MKWKVVVPVVAVLFAAYTASQSYLVAQAGAEYQVAQLEGDGGAGFVFTFLCLVSGFLIFVRPVIAAIAFAVATAVGVLVGLYYGDNVVLLWALGPAVLGAVSLYVHFASKRRKGRVQSTRMGTSRS